VEIREEGMREGMQIESVDISVDDKVRLLEALSKTGLRQIVVGSFVSPRYTPQMAQIDDIVSRLNPVPGVEWEGMALNPKGRERAAAYPILTPPSRVPTLHVHLCDTFIRRNTNQSQQQEIDRWPAIIQHAVDSGATEVGIGVGAAWGSNFTGHRSTQERMDMLGREHDLWDEAGLRVTSVSFADPMSWCMPNEVDETIRAILDTWPEITKFHQHLHDGRGMALPSIWATLNALDARHSVGFDTTFGGIGGCPYCGNGRATGMAATEDVVNMLDALGIDHNVDLDKLIDAVWMLEEVIGRATPGHVSKAGPNPRTPDTFYDANLPLIETFDEAKHFKLGERVAEHQIRPWREPIPAPDFQASVR
jgi:hydroxymethylglutaryl-CoA lyase